MHAPPRTILVTGATGGIGRAVCHRLAEGGATLLLAARDAGRLHSLCAELPARGAADHAWLSVDMTLDASVRQFADALSAQNVIFDDSVMMLPQDPPTRRQLLIAGGTLFMPALLQAQQASDKVVRIGILVGGSLAQRGHLERALLEGLREQGLVEGKSLIVERRYADGRNERTPEFARELAAMNLDVVITTCTPSTRAAKQATTSMPIVMAAVADPVGQHLIVSLSRPGANVTGLSSQAEDIMPKMLQLFAGVLPRPATVAVLAEARSDVHPHMWQQLRPTADALQLNLVKIDVANPAGLPAAFDAALGERATALFVLPDEPLFLSQRATIIELAARHRLPAFYGAREFVDDGGLMSYGESLRAAYRKAASYIGSLARGTKPTELPVEQPTKFELVINLKTAKTLGITMPQALLLRADELIQ